MLEEFRTNYNQILSQNKQRPNQGIIDTSINLRDDSLRYIDDSAYS